MVRSSSGLSAFTMLLVIAACVLATAAAPAVLNAKGRPQARAAGAINAVDNAELHYNPRKSEGAILIEEGEATGSLPGWVEARINAGAVSTLTGSLRFNTHGSVITGHGSAHLSGPRANGVESFHGSMTITGGTGRYRHAHGSAGLYGLFYRTSQRERNGRVHHSFDVTVQTTGTIHD